MLDEFPNGGARPLHAIRILVLGIALVGLGACSHFTDKEQRMLSGGAIGAAGGAALGLATGGSWLAGGVIGAAVGTVAAAIMAR